MAGTILRLHQLNDVKLVGRITRDPEIRFTAKGQAVCRLDLAVNRRYKDSTTGEWKDDTSFIPVVVWRETAQRCGERLKKGSPVYVEGRLKSRNWETKDGQKRTSIEVDVRSIQFLEKFGAEAEGNGEAQEEAAPSTAEAPSQPSNESAEEEIPF